MWYATKTDDRPLYPVRQIYPLPPKLAAVKSELEKPPSLESWHPKSSGISPNKAEPPKFVTINLNLVDR